MSERKWTPQRKLALDIALHNHIVHTGDKANREELVEIREMARLLPEISVCRMAAAPAMYEALIKTYVWIDTMANRSPGSALMLLELKELLAEADGKEVNNG